MQNLFRALFLSLLAAGPVWNQAPETVPASQPAPSVIHPWLWSRMAEDITKIANDVDGRVGVYIRSLSSGETFALRADEAFPAASTIKLALLYELYRQSEARAPGSARFQDAYQVQSKDLVEDSHILGNLVSGTRLTLRDLALFTVAVSDNSATNILIDRVGMDRVNASLERLGLRRTRLRRKMMDVQAAREGRENLTSPRELSELLGTIQGGALSAESRGDLMRLLSIPKEGYLTRLLPEGLPVANKPGTLPGVRNDAGIIQVKGHPFVIAVMASHLRDERQGEAAIARIAQRAAACFEMAGAASPEGRILGVLQVR
jgi:beta-lactamase class A